MMIPLLTGVVACQAPGGDDPDAGVDVTCEAGELPTIPTARERGAPTDRALRQELLRMRDADQAERTGVVAANNDARRADRLREVIEEHGWPTPDLVGQDGASAAWLIAQHADFDVAFQRSVLGRMCAAVAAGDADPTELAFLVDRVAVNSDRPQFYGTQVAGCQGGQPALRPVADEEGVRQRRQHVGLQPLAEYLALFEEECAAGGGG
jgi:hypothetical protein